MRVSTVMGDPQARWMGYFMENPIKMRRLVSIGKWRYPKLWMVYFMENPTY